MSKIIKQQKKLIDDLTDELVSLKIDKVFVDNYLMNVSTLQDIVLSLEQLYDSQVKDEIEERYLLNKIKNIIFYGQ